MHALSVRTKILLTVAISIVALSAAVYFISSLVLLPSYAAIEREAMERDLNRAVDAIGEFSDTQMIKLADWAQWDESYQYTVTRDMEWIRTSIFPDSMANLDNNLALFADETGTPFFLMVTDIAAREETSSDTIRAYLAAHPELVTHTTFESATEGLIMLPDGPLILVSLPVRTSEGEGPILGSLSFGRYLDADKVREIGEITHLALSVYRYDDPALPDGPRQARAALEAGAPYVIAPVSSDLFTGYALLRDVYGEPALILKVEEPRPIYAQGNATFSLYLIIGALALIAFGIIMVFLLDRIVIARFVRLTADVDAINDEKDLSKRVSGGEGDEIGRLAAQINRLLGWLSEAREGEAAARREMVNLLDDLKKQQEQTEEMRRLTGKADRLDA